MRTIAIFVLFTCQVIFGLNGYSQSDFSAISKKEHPRLLLLKGAEASIKNAVAKNNDFKRVHDIVLSEANNMLSAPALEHKKIGKRLLSVSREAIRRVFFLSYAYRITEGKKYLNAAEAQLKTISAFPDWNPSHYLDVAEMTMAAAIGYDWLYQDLPANTKVLVQKAILEKGIQSSLLPENNFWLKVDNNWNQVCNAGIAYGAVAIYETNPELCGSMIQRAVESIKIPMKLYGPDGAYPEGYSYWSYGTTFNVLFIDLLEQLLDTDYGLTDIPGFKKTATYFQQMIAPTGNPFDYADSGTGAEPNGAMFWFANKLNKPSLGWNEIQFIRKEKNLEALAKNRFLPAVLIWGKDFANTGIQSPAENFWEGGGVSPVAMMRSSWTDPNALFLGFKSGSPAVNHAHMDVGSFIFEADGIRWSMDFGMQNYQSLEAKGLNIWLRTQNSERWSVYRYRNEAHSTLTFGDSLQRLSGSATIDKYGTREKFRFAQSDISPVYNGQVKKAIRGVGLVNNEYAVIQDEIEALETPAKMQWRMATPATVKIKAGKEIVLEKDGKQLLLQIVADQPVTIKSWSTAPTTDYDAPNPGTTIVGFETTLPANSKQRFVVNLVPVKRKAIVPAKITPLSNWK